MGVSISATDRRPDAHGAVGRLLVVDRVTPLADHVELGSEVPADGDRSVGEGSERSGPQERNASPSVPTRPARPCRGRWHVEESHPRRPTTSAVGAGYRQRLRTPTFLAARSPGSPSRPSTRAVRPSQVLPCGSPPGPRTGPRAPGRPVRAGDVATRPTARRSPARYNLASRRNVVGFDVCEQALDLRGTQLAVIGEQLEQVEGALERPVRRRCGVNHRRKRITE